ncbi:hypothetical protein PR202_gb19110 [Eleusine coracana subsp. coracana]|uniref:Uncharacterized protein n=1 Tax=Eleusine coracana subsp. coracana TaxID=191504 RepID=A0AAV5F550_ELECO|nr:hypothetical protein PR202_gb19110 [Eleusine coracana subsp. coracana]
MAAAEEEEEEVAAAAPWKEEEEEEEREKGKKKKIKKRYGLVEYRALPGYLRDNEYILRHYRCEWPLPQVLLSAFTIHNETLNVWTYVNPSLPHSRLSLLFVWPDCR